MCPYFCDDVCDSVLLSPVWPPPSPPPTSSDPQPGEVQRSTLQSDRHRTDAARRALIGQKPDVVMGRAVTDHQFFVSDNPDLEQGDNDSVAAAFSVPVS